MPSAEIITIGTEILLGEIVDTNAHHIARVLRDHGVDIFRTASVGDNVERISDTVRRALARSQIVITTGGLGPTIDDPTREAIAHALGVKTEFREELWQQVVHRFAQFDRYPSENNRRQAYVPVGAIGIQNPVGTAPAFLVETDGRVIISLPGVPREMEYLLENAVIPALGERFSLDSVLVVRLVKTAGVGESQIDERIGDLEHLSNPTVGLAAHAGQVDVRITAKAKNRDAAEALIQPVEADIRERLSEWVFGSDQESLADIVNANLSKKNWTICIVEAGLGGQWLADFPLTTTCVKGVQLFSDPPKIHEELLGLTDQFYKLTGADIGLGISLYPDEKSKIMIALITAGEEKIISRSYGGSPKLAAKRAVYMALNLLRAL